MKYKVRDTLLVLQLLFLLTLSCNKVVDKPNQLNKVSVVHTAFKDKPYACKNCIVLSNCYDSLVVRRQVYTERTHAECGRYYDREWVQRTRLEFVYKDAGWTETLYTTIVKDYENKFNNLLDTFNANSCSPSCRKYK